MTKKRALNNSGSAALAGQAFFLNFSIHRPAGLKSRFRKHEKNKLFKGLKYVYILFIRTRRTLCKKLSPLAQLNAAKGSPSNTSWGLVNMWNTLKMDLTGATEAERSVSNSYFHTTPSWINGYTICLRHSTGQALTPPILEWGTFWMNGLNRYNW